MTLVLDHDRDLIDLRARRAGVNAREEVTS